MKAELAEVQEFLGQHAPFNELPEGVLATLPAKMRITYFRRGSMMLARGEKSDGLFVLRSGAAEVRDKDERLVAKLEPGESFGYPSLLTGDDSFQVKALEDTLVYTLPEQSFHQLRQTHDKLERFYAQAQAARIRSALVKLQSSKDDVALLTTRLKDLALRAPVSVEPKLSIREAAQRMVEQGISSLVIQDDRPRGIVTDRDLRGRVVAQARDYEAPVEAIMTAEPLTISHEAYAFEALLTMTQHNIHHLPVVQKGNFVGMVTATDLMRLQTANPIYLVGDIRKQDSVAGLVEASKRLPAVVQRLVEADATADDIGRVVTTIGDAIETRLLELAEAKLGPPPVPYVWLVLGSQARHEQSAHSDQDNALLLSDDVSKVDDDYFLALARFVSDGLNACGYDYCPGDIMATNSRWRQPLSVWRSYFEGWILRPEPEALLNSTIFFDMRALYGDKALCETLKARFLEQTQGNQPFLAHLAKTALDHSPPLGFFKTFVLEKDGEHLNTFDLKHKGVVPIIDLARVYALGAGITKVNTQARLRNAAEASSLSPEGAANLRDALEFISYVRLRHQGQQVRRGESPHNFVNPDDLSSFEKRHLKDAFQIVRTMQNALAQRFQLRFLG